MKQVILTIGPQHIGKSTFCNKIIDSHPDLTLISRDGILVELFGSPYLSPYTGGHYIGYEVMWERIEEHLKKNEVTIILDCWNGPDNERKNIVEKLRLLGVDTVGAWYFITPRETCLEWEIEKVEQKKDWRNEEWRIRKLAIAKENFLEHYDHFYKNAHPGEEFDFIVKLNPLAPPTFDTLFSSIPTAM